jgi:hypothetical protein
MNENATRTLAIGAIAIAALVLLGPTVAANAKPLIRRGVKAAVKGYVESRESIAELQELVEDAYAEAWAELEAAARSPAGAAPTAAATAPTKEAGVAPKGKTRRRKA